MAVSVLLVFCACLLAACTPAPSTAYWDDARYQQSPGTIEQDNIVFEENGWRVWRRITKRDVHCIAVKPSEENEWPHFVNNFGYVNSFVPGFYMVITEHDQEPYFGFYGATSFGKHTFIDYRGKVLRGINRRDQVLALDSELIDFRISTQTSPDIYDEVERLSGTLDFTGVNTAYESMMACYEFIRRI